MSDTANEDVNQPTQATMLVMALIKELHHTGILSEREGNHIIHDYGALSPYSLKAMDPVSDDPEMREFTFTVIALGGLFNDDIKKTMMEKMRDKEASI